MDDAALALRDKGKSQSAIAKLRPIVAKHPSNFRAVYILATALLQNSSKANQGEGMSTLLRALDLLPGQSQPCIVSFGWYSIYDTLGAQYHRRGDDANALRYFNLAAAHFDDQTAWTKSDLLGNLGQYYFTQGDLTKSLDYYQRAEKAGNHQAASRIAAIQAVNSTRYRAD